MRSAEGIVHVQVYSRHKLIDESRIVRLLARIEAKVLHQLNTRGEAGQDLSNWPHRILRFWLSLRSSEVARAHDLGTPRGEIFDRWQRCADSKVIGHDARIIWPAHGNVEIRANEHPSASDVAEVFE
jgi:hypothetical protein